MSPGEVASGLLDNDGAALGAPGWAQEEYYTPLFTTQSAYRDSTIVIDTEGYPNNEERANNDRYLDAADMIDRNKAVIAKEVVSTMNDLSKYENLAIPGGHVNCEDDVLDMIDAMVHDIRLNCNEKVWDAANLYVEPENNSLKHIESEWEASITVVKILRDILTMTMRNAFGRDYDLDESQQTKPVQSYNQNPKDNLFATCGDAIDGNIRYIAEQAVAAGLLQYPNLAIPGGPVNCVHDVTDILRAMIFNLKNGGTNFLQYASEFYTTYSGNLDHVTNAPTETNFIINKAKEFAIRAMKGQVISNDAGWTVDQRFYDAVPRPVTSLYNADENGLIQAQANNIITRSFIAGEDKISTTDTGTGIVPSEDAVFRCIAKLPTNPIDGVIWEAGGTGAGAYLGIRDNGTYLRLRAGTGANSYAGGAGHSETGMAMLDLTIASLSTYFDGGDHELVWQITVGGNIAAGKGAVRLWIDGVQVGFAETVGAGYTGLYASPGIWAGSNNSGYGVQGGTSICAGEPSTINTFTVNVGPAPTIKYDVNTAAYDSSTGDLILDVGGHNHTEGTFLKLVANSINFTCNQDGNSTTHSYPRSGDPAGNTAVEVLETFATEYQATGAVYTPSSGIMKLTIPSHGMSNHSVHTATDSVYDPNTGVLQITVDDHGFKTGEQVRIENGSLIFTCAQDNHASKHGYPRQKDPAADQWLLIESVVSKDIFTVNVGSTPKVEYDVSNAIYDQNTGDMEINIGQHRFVGSDTHVASHAEYHADTGHLKLTVANHNVTTGDQIQIMENSMTFTCSMDNHYTNHVYPRTSDPATRKWLDVVESDIEGGTFTVNVGQSPIKGFTPTAATFNSTTGALTLTIGSHTLAVGTNIKLAQESLTFTCDMDDHATNHSYPRDKDPIHNEPLAILAVTSDSITVNVGTTPTVNYSVLNAAFNAADGHLSLVLDRKHSFRQSTIHSITDGEFDGQTGLMRVTVADHGFSNGDYVKIADGGITFTCSMDNHETTHAYPRSSDQMSGKWMDVRNSSKDSFDVFVGRTPAIPFTIGAATFDPTTGLMVATIGNHNLKVGHSVRLAKESVVFTCYLDAHNTTHAYPRSNGNDPFYNKPIEIQAVTDTTITLKVANTVPITDQSAHIFIPNSGMTPTNVNHNPTTGVMTITVVGHGMENGDMIKIQDNGIVLTCALDDHQTTHAYPRPSDPASASWLKISGVTADTFDVQVLGGNAPQSDTSIHLFSSAIGNCITRASVVSGGIYDHTYSTSTVDCLRHAGDTIRLADDSLTFRCDEDGQASDHTYPRAATTSVTPTEVTYDPNIGHLKFTVAGHNFLPYSYVKIADNSLTFTCKKDNDATDHTYPRSTDPVSGKWMMIHDVTTDTFTVEVLDVIPSTNTTVHSISNIATNCITHKKDYFYDAPIPIHEVDKTDHTPTNISYNPTGGWMQVTMTNSFSDATSMTPTGATFYPATGTMKIDLSGHSVKNGDMILINEGAFTFRCDEDGQSSDHPYPRSSDPASNKWLKAFNVGGNSFDVNVGNFMGEGAISNTTTHVCTSIASNQVFKANDFVMFDENAITFQCTKDQNATNHTYPRRTDPTFGKWLPIANVTNTSFTVWVGKSGVNDVYDHTFVSVASNSLKRQTGTITLDVGNGLISNNTTHVFQSASPNAVISGGAYNHTFVPSTQAYTPTGANYNPVTGVMTLTIKNHGFLDGESIKINTNSLVFTCLQDSNGSDHPYPRSTDPVANKWLTISNCTNDTFDVQVLETIPSTNVTLHTFKSALTGAVTRATVATGGNYKHKFVAPAQLTPTNAAYTPSTGLMTLTVANHGLKNGSRVKVEDGFVTFTCTQDSNQSNHSYPRASDPYSDEWMTVKNVTKDTFTIQVLFNIPSSNTTTHTFVSARPQSITVATLMKGNDSVKLAADGFSFKCAKDGNATIHTYPRATDPAYENSLRIIDDGVTRHTPTAASYTPSTGVLSMTVSKHGFSNGDYIQIEDYALDMSCDMDNDSSTHAYPRGTDPISNKWVQISNVSTDGFDVNVGTTAAVNYTPTDADYTPTTGEMEVTIGTHPLKVGQSIQIATGGITLECSQDSYGSTHAYPRSTVDTFTPTNAVYDGPSGYLTITSSAHGLDEGSLVKIDDNAITLRCTMDGSISDKTYPRSTDPVSGKWKPIEYIDANTYKIFVGKSEFRSFDPQNVDYNPSTGVMVITVGPDHGITTAHSVYINHKSMCFTCGLDSYNTDHFYPRANGESGASGDDPAYQDAVDVTAVSDSTITVNVGVSSNTTTHVFKPAVGKTPTAITYSPNTGLMTVTIAGHGMTDGEQVMFEEHSLIFTCAKDDHATEHAYPRPTDPFANKFLTIDNVTNDTFRVNVGISSNTSSHTFKRAKVAAVKRGTIRSGGSFTHSFQSFANNGLSAKRDRAYDHALEIMKVGHAKYSATGAAYNPTTGILTLTVANNPFANGDHVRIADDSLVMTCDMDNNGSNHSYPRATDPASGKWLEISGVSGNDFNVNVGTTPRANYLVSAATYEPTTGVMTMTIGAHSYNAGESVYIEDQSLVFKCAADNYGSEHKYPRANGEDGATGDDPYYDTKVPITAVTADTITVNVGISSNTTAHQFVRSENAFTPSTASYVPGTGVLTLTLSGHPFENGDKIQLMNESIVFQCQQDAYGSDHAYPRAQDPAANDWLTISNKTSTTFDVNVGVSSNTTTHQFASAVTGAIIRGTIRGGGEYTHAFVSAVADGLEKKNSTITVNVGSTVAGNHTHRFASATSGAITAGGNHTHAFETFKNNSLHRQSGWITVNVGIAATADLYDHTFYTALAGAVIGGGNYQHTFISAKTDGIWKSNDYIYIKDHALGFTCDLDNYRTTHLYPRATDHASNEWLAVSNVVGDTFDVQVLKGVPSSFLGSHTFESCDQKGIRIQNGKIRINVGVSPAGKTYQHTFVSANSGCLIQGGNYKHNFVSALSNSINVVNDGTQLTPTDAYYEPTTGQLTLTVAGHSLRTDDAITIDTNSLTFTCSQDSNTTNHTYPRVTDYADGKILPVQSVLSYAYPLKTDLDYYRARRVDPSYTGNEGASVESEIGTLMQLVTDAITSPNTIATRGYTMPIIWPVKYTPDTVNRDLTVTYDSDAGGQDDQGTWNQTCAETASAINTLADIFIETIDKAANTQTNHLVTITKTYPYNSNDAYQSGTCYNVTSALDTLYELMTDALGGGMSNSKMIADMLLFNQQAITLRAFTETQGSYPTTNLTIDFAEAVLKAVRYDLTTGGNAGAFKLSQTWFDGEGNFIAFTNVTRTHILFCLTKIREFTKSILYEPDHVGWDPYAVYIHQDLEWNKEAAEFMIDSSLNPLEFALEMSTFPTEARVTFVASTDATNRLTKNEMGIDYNTDPDLVSLTPEVDVGYDRAEYRIRIERPNNFRRGDVLSYIPASETSLTGLAGQAYFYCLTGTAEWFEVGASYIHDGRFRLLQVDKSNSGSQIFSVERRSGVARTAPTYGVDTSECPIQGGFNAADVVYGSTSNANAEVGTVLANEGEIYKLFTHYETVAAQTTPGTYDMLINGEEAQVQNAAANKGSVLQTVTPDSETGVSFLRLHTVAGTISTADVLIGATSGKSHTVGNITDRFLINVKNGSFASGDWFFSKVGSVEAYMDDYISKSGSLTGNDGGRITIDVETIESQWIPGDVIYGSITDYILEVKGISGTQIQLNQWLHGTRVLELDLGVAIIDTGVSDTFNIGDEVTLLQGTTQKNPGFTAVVTKYINDPDTSTHKLWIANLVDVGLGAPLTDLTQAGNHIGKVELGSNFPTIYAGVSTYTETGYTSYAKVVAIQQQGITATIWVESANGIFVDNMSLKSDFNWGGGVTSARTLEGRVDRYFRGFDGTQTIFDLTVSNGEAYFPDPAGHLLTFVNGILQPPGGNFSYVAFSDKIQFSEAPDIGSEFIGYYVGKLRQLDDISFEFDSLKSSFNLKRGGLFYSLTLTEGVSSNTIRPENNIIVSLNGVIQEPGVAYEIVGSRIIFAEVPRAGATFVGFSYIGSDADVIAATVVPPIEAGDKLAIEGEEFNREVALIESSNSLITFEYTGSIKGRNAAAIASITSGQIIGATLTNPGDGYTSRPNVDVISSSGFDSRIKALMGITRIDVKTTGIGYSSPAVAIDNEVPDDWTPPVGGPINGGFDVLAGEGPGNEEGGGGGITPGTIAITQDPVNVTVNQGQTAAFTVVSTVTNDQTMNYQWQKKEYGTQTWGNIIGANQSTYNTNNTAQADDGDEYRVAITAAGATPVYSLSAILSVQTGATVISNFTPNLIFDDI